MVVQTKKGDKVGGSDSDIPAVDFGVVAGGKEQFDICRLFLASLQLVSYFSFLFFFFSFFHVDPISHISNQRSQRQTAIRNKQHKTTL